MSPEAVLIERTPAAWPRIRAVARRHYYVMLRSPHRLFDVTIWPCVDVLLFGAIGRSFDDQAGGDIGKQAFGLMLVGIVLWHVIYQSQIALSTGFLEETWSRNILNLMVTPLREVEYAAGVVLFGMVKVALGVGLVGLLAFTAFAFDVTDLGLALVPVAAVLLLTGWLIALFVIGLVLRFGTGAEALAWGILFAVMPLSGVFYPLDALPAFVRPIGYLLPTTYAFSAARAVLAGEPLPWDTLGLAALSTAVLLVAAVAWLAHMLAVFRRRGYVTRYS